MIYLSAFSLVRSFCSPGTLTNKIASILFYFEATNRIGLFWSLQNENEQRRIKKLFRSFIGVIEIERCGYGFSKGFYFRQFININIKAWTEMKEAHLFLREYKYI